jgi:RHS repeat-associated protein
MSDVKTEAAEALYPLLSHFHKIENQALKAVWKFVDAGLIERIVLDFGKVSLLVDADSEYDTINFVVKDCTRVRRTEYINATRLDPWKSFIDKPFVWGWVIINQQGYCDGLLLSFDSIAPNLILNVIGSEIKVGIVTGLLDSHGSLNGNSRIGPFQSEPPSHKIIDLCKFSGKERDAETGLDYFGARYYSGAQGRFMSPDWSEKPTPVPYADLNDPQTLNLYAYVRNNPLALTDPDGHGFLDWLRGVACSAGMEGMCVKQETKKQEDPKVEREELIEAQDDARSNPAFQPSASMTQCNQATCFVAERKDAPMQPLIDKSGNPVRANQQAQNLEKSNQYREVTREEAQRIANQGGLVIVAYEDTGGGSGHTATVRPTGVQGDSPPRGGRGPLINDIGRRVRVQNENFTFRKGTEVRYYTPRRQP